ncbi:hypothetical protein NIES267_41750 [Calothrix parasitica NIES-267]|uniref:Uncharacterized protein n=1 Tax=Calothrix parasitica NIES-267 TaxID=1973488 RepID=A0A1Z4LTY2_9CYAN|nr:hypothetical protein NIES267_41750 [Calothrix parasitica NIES-267]
MFEIATAIIGVLGLVAATAIAALSIKNVLTWFFDRLSLRNQDELKFTLKDKLNSGNFKVYQGFIDPYTHRISDYRVVSPSRIDHEINDDYPILYPI